MEQQEEPEQAEAEQEQVLVQEPAPAEVPEQVQVPERVLQRQVPGQAVQPREDWPRVPLQQRQ